MTRDPIGYYCDRRPTVKGSGSWYTWYHPTRLCLLIARLTDGAEVKPIGLPPDSWSNNCSRCEACGKYVNVKQDK